MFKLENDKTPVKKKSFGAGKDSQSVLFSGMDCLAGQLDLFKTDGKLPEESSQDSTDAGE